MAVMARDAACRDTMSISTGHRDANYSHLTGARTCEDVHVCLTERRPGWTTPATPRQWRWCDGA